MNICADSSCQVVQSNSIQASVAQAGNRQIDKTSQYAAQTTLQRTTTLFSEQWTDYLSVTSTNVLNRASRISPTEILSSSTQALKGMGKYVLVAVLISSRVIPTVNAAGLTITTKPVYQVLENANTTLVDPYISVAGAEPVSMYCRLLLTGTTSLQGIFYAPGLVVSSSAGWTITGTPDFINSAFQNLQFESNRANVSAPVEVLCGQTAAGKSGLVNILLTSMPVTTTTSTIPSTGSKIPSFTTSTNAPVTSLTSFPTTQPQLIPATASSALQTQSVASNLFSSMSTIASEQSQNMATGTLVTTASLLASVSQIQTQFDPVQMTSTPNDFNRYGWIIVTIAGVLLCAGGLVIVGILVRKKSNEKAVEDGVPGNVVQKPIDNSQYSQVPPPPYDIVPTLDVQNNYAGIPAGQQPNHYHAPAARSNNGNQAGSNVYQNPDARLISGNTIVANDLQNGPSPYIAANAPMDS